MKNVIADLKRSLEYLQQELIIDTERLTQSKEYNIKKEEELNVLMLRIEEVKAAIKVLEETGCSNESNKCKHKKVTS